MHVRKLIISVFSLLTAANAQLAQIPAQNFRGPEPFRTAAEQCRRASSRFWTGTDLPGRWAQPCPITVTFQPHSGGGQTSFLFDDGEVFGWNMRLEGHSAAVMLGNRSRGGEE